MNRILVATDFSSASNQAFAFSVKLAKQLSGEIVAVYVKDVDDFALAVREKLKVNLRNSAEIKKAVADFIERQYQSLLKKFGGSNEISIRFVVAEGEPSVKLLEIAKEERATLIATGTRSRSAAANVLLGSTASQLVRHAHCPVVTVRGRKESQ